MVIDKPLTDDEFEEMCTRRLDHTRYERLFIESSYVKTRVEGSVRYEAVVGLIGERSDGPIEILGFDVGDSEDSEFWSRVLFVLRIRGLRGLREVVSQDEHSGLADALSATFPGVVLTCGEDARESETRRRTSDEDPNHSVSAPPRWQTYASPGAVRHPGGAGSSSRAWPPAAR